MMMQEWHAVQWRFLSPELEVGTFKTKVGDGELPGERTSEQEGDNTPIRMPTSSVPVPTLWRGHA